MTTGSTGTKRRTLLQRGFALLAGGAAIAGGSRWAAAASPPAALPATFKVYARKSDVFDRPGGDRIGSFYTNTLGAPSTFGVQTASSSVAFHVLQLKDGSLFSVSGAADPGARSLAIIGGTERFAGKSGNCIERALPGELATDDIRELTITFAS